MKMEVTTFIINLRLKIQKEVKRNN